MVGAGRDGRDRRWRWRLLCVRAAGRHLLFFPPSATLCWSPQCRSNSKASVGRCSGWSKRRFSLSAGCAWMNRSFGASAFWRDLPQERCLRCATLFPSCSSVSTTPDPNRHVSLAVALALAAALYWIHGEVYPRRWPQINEQSDFEAIAMGITSYLAVRCGGRGLVGCSSLRVGRFELVGARVLIGLLRRSSRRLRLGCRQISLPRLR